MSVEVECPSGVGAMRHGPGDDDDPVCAARCRQRARARSAFDARLLGHEEGRAICSGCATASRQRVSLHRRGEGTVNDAQAGRDVRAGARENSRHEEDEARARALMSGGVGGCQAGTRLPG